MPTYFVFTTTKWGYSYILFKFLANIEEQLIRVGSGYSDMSGLCCRSETHPVYRNHILEKKKER